VSYQSLSEAVCDLEKTGQLRRISCEVDAHLELAAIQRRAWQAQSPALLFTNIKGCRFPVAANLFGTLPRARFLLRHGLRAVEQAMKVRAEPWTLLKAPLRTLDLGLRALHLIPRRRSSAPVLACRCTLAELPQQVSWPLDGGPFVTLPLVYTEHPAKPGWLGSNLGMYRVQLAGNRYGPHEVGLHYQIHRGIGVHHAAAVERGQDLPVRVLVGGPPALMLAAVMPLPEGMPELALAGLLAGRRLTLAQGTVGEADFCIRGRVRPGRTLPEGPFGDHLGYYSLQHDFPVLEVEEVTHRPGAIWPITSVGRPPQEDTVFGELIHELTGPVIPAVLPGVKAVHAVDAAGVHPLLLAQASERYTPYASRKRPQEILTAACAILSQGQLSLAKYLWICAAEDDPSLRISDIPAFFRHMLERADWRRDLHFHTQTTIDTLDYSGGALNQGSKLVVAAVGPPTRELTSQLPEIRRPLKLVMPGVAVVSGEGPPSELAEALDGLALVSWVDDVEFAAASLANWLWVTFTRSDPARDVHGARARTENKHWGCEGTLLIDARSKPHHAPPLEEDPEVVRRIEALAAPGQPLQGLF